MKRSLIDNLRSMATLLSDSGEGYTPPEGPQAGMGIQQWGYNQALDQRHDTKQRFWQNRGNKLFGFLPPSNATPLPNAWETMGHVVKGRANAVDAAGGRLRMPDPADYYNNAPGSTRFDDEQVGIETGQTLGADKLGFQDALNNTSRPSHRILGDLRRRFGI
jgi:hypothetical protein